MSCDPRSGSHERREVPEQCGVAVVEYPPRRAEDRVVPDHFELASAEHELDALQEVDDVILDKRDRSSDGDYAGQDQIDVGDRVTDRNFEGVRLLPAPERNDPDALLCHD